MTNTCARCGRTLDTGTPAESEYSTKVRAQVGSAYSTVCASCLLLSPPTENER